MKFFHKRILADGVNKGRAISAAVRRKRVDFTQVRIVFTISKRELSTTTYELPSGCFLKAERLLLAGVLALLNELNLDRSLFCR